MNKTKITLKIKKPFTNHNMFATLIILATVCSLCLACANANNATNIMTTPSEQTLASSVKHSQKTAEILYEQKVGNLTNEQIDQLWPSNNPRSWVLTGTMDGEITKRYKAWHNRYKSQVKGTPDERGLEDDSDLTIKIKNLDIRASAYQDIRLIIDYFTSSSYTSLTHTYSLELYVIDANNKRYGPFRITNFETTGFFMVKTEATEIFKRNFNLITENIKIPNIVKIKELVIKPYANYPRTKGASLGSARDSRHADITTFEIAGIKVVGYRDSTHTEPNYIKFKKINVNATRDNIVKRMYDTATIKWTPSEDFHPLRSTDTNYSVTKIIYRKGKTYYGIPYTQRNKVPIEKFAHEVRNGILSTPKNSLQIWGVDCAGSVSYSISKFIPMHVIYNSDDFIWERNKTTLLGNLKIDGRESSTEILKSQYSEQKIYEAYAELQKGDIVATHHKTNSHVMLVTGNSYTVRNDIGTINPEESYFFRTDINMGQVDTIKNSDNFGGQVVAKDIIVPFYPQKKYTDIKTLSELKNTKLNFYINKKMTFKEAYNRNYVPITLNAYRTATIEEPYARIINANTVKDIKGGLKGTIVSNYTIINVRFDVKNNETDLKKTFIDYPNHNMGTLESKFGNTYSLFYNTPQYIKNNIQKIIRGTDKFEVSVFVTTGEQENTMCLLLKS